MKGLTPFATAVFSLVLALALLLLIPGDGGPVKAAPNFNASTTVTLTSTATNADADQNSTFSIPSPDYNFSNVVTAGAAAAFLAPTPGGAGFVAGTHPALGDVVGTLSSATFLGLANGPCNTNLTVNFTFLAATVNNGATNLISPVPQGGVDGNPATTADNPQGGVLANQWSDDGSWPDIGDSGGNGPGPDRDIGTTPVNGIPAQVERYPSYLNTVFTPDGGSPVQPLARYAGAQNVAALAVMLNFVIFSNNALSSAFSPPHPFADLGDTGYTSISVLQDPTQPAAPSAITDFCSPLNVTVNVFGETKANNCVTGAPICNNASPTVISNPTVGGTTGRDRARNPSTAGTYLYIGYHQSLRDFDNDGKENNLDPCPTTSDTFDHRTGTGSDGDSDGIPDACDTIVGGGADQDGDGWQNRGDNCPQMANPTNAEAENVPSPYTSSAPRGGFRTDGMGDECDPNPGLAQGIFQTTLSLNPKCIGGTDVDGDGWCAAAGGGLPADPNDSSPSVVPEAYDAVFPMALTHAGSGTPLTRQPVQACNDGVDNDGDGVIDLLDHGMFTLAPDLPKNTTSCKPVGVVTPQSFSGGCPALGCATDWDGDGYSNEQEVWAGTDPLGRCGVGAVPSPSKEWPADFISGGTPSSTDVLTLGDILSFVAPAPKKLGANPGDAGPAPAPAYNRRWDIQAGPGPFSTHINISDLLSLISGASGFPAMFSGSKAFASPAPVCSAHPTYGASP